MGNKRTLPARAKDSLDPFACMKGKPSASLFMDTTF